MEVLLSRGVEWRSKTMMQMKLLLFVGGEERQLDLELETGLSGTEEPSTAAGGSNNAEQCGDTEGWL
jgi:hypothetical protein